MNAKKAHISRRKPKTTRRSDTERKSGRDSELEQTPSAAFLATLWPTFLGPAKRRTVAVVSPSWYLWRLGGRMLRRTAVEMRSRLVGLDLALVAGAK